MPPPLYPPTRSMSRDDGVKAVVSPDILTPGEAQDRMAMPPPQSPLGAMSVSRDLILYCCYYWRNMAYYQYEDQSKCVSALNT